ncbi:MAG: recQ [Anaerophaga sp.]|nr:recQ [Anaerophaga sp.]MDN5290261.1 ATP-dependent helicase RecQ [Anaerophaga sp.]
MKQLQAGYILDCVKETLEMKYKPTEVQGLLRQLSYFDIDINSTAEFKDNSKFEQVLSVTHNIISRGLPTRPTLWLENKILQPFGLTQIDKKMLEIGTLSRVLKVEETLIQKLFRALHIIDPNLGGSNISKQKIKTWENLGSSFEENFLYEQLPKHASHIWIQLFETQRELENVLRFSTTSEDEVEKYLNGSINIFNAQRLDFSVEFPYKIKEQRGFVVEIDGTQHENYPQNRIDADRDNATEKAKWGKAIRIKTLEWNNIANRINNIKKFENEQFFSLLKQNIENPLYSEKEGLTALQLSLIPFAVARIQKTIIHLLFEGKLNLDSRFRKIIDISANSFVATGNDNNH